MRRTHLAAAVLCALSAAANATPLPDYVKDTLGEWLVATDDGKPGCRITLKGETAPGGYRALPSPDCTARLPVVAKAVAWAYDGGVKILGTDRQVLLDFQEDETTLMKTSFERKPVHFIVKAKAGADRAPYAPALVGRWILRRPGGPTLCSLVLTRDAKSEETEVIVKPGTPCDPAVARLRLDSARVEDFKLMLYGQPVTSLGFEPSGAESYVKTDGGRPLEMVRVP